MNRGYNLAQGVVTLLLGSSGGGEVTLTPHPESASDYTTDALLAYITFSYEYEKFSIQLVIFIFFFFF